MVFQIHLWLGLGAGLYFVAMSVTGSVLVYNAQLQWLFSPETRRVVASGPRLDWNELHAVGRANYPGYNVAIFANQLGTDSPVVMSLTLDGSRSPRLLNPYSGADLGAVKMTPGWLVLGWATDFHNSLLAGRIGQEWNGLGGVALAVAAVAGLLLWWSGLRSWRTSLRIQRRGSWRRLVRDLHGAVGAWTFAFVLMWALTGILLSFPGPFMALLEVVHPGLDNAVSYVSGAMHVGGFGGWPIKLMWASLGLGSLRNVRVGRHHVVESTKAYQTLTPHGRPQDDREESQRGAIQRLAPLPVPADSLLGPVGWYEFGTNTTVTTSRIKNYGDPQGRLSLRI